MNVYEKDWDLLVVLDGCRVDALQVVDDVYAFLDDSGTHRSTASTSAERMRTMFSDEIKDTMYVTANQDSFQVVDLPFLAFKDLRLRAGRRG